MTLKELIEKYGYSESAWKKNFRKYQEKILNIKGVWITKTGRGDNTVYHEEVRNDMRALTLYESREQNIILRQETIRLDNWQFLAFVAIVTTPLKVFRGSYKDFLKYAGVNVTEENINILKLTLSALEEREIIIYIKDKTDDNYFTATLVRKAEVEMQVGIDMMRECKKIAKANNKRNWIPLFKVWLAVLIMEEHQPFTNKELEEVTGMSEYTVRENKKLLEKNEIFKTKKTYADCQTCLGQLVVLNGMLEENNKYKIETIDEDELEFLMEDM